MARQITRWEDCRGKLHDYEAQATAAERTYAMEDEAEQLVAAMDAETGDNMYGSLHADIAKWLIGDGAERLITLAAKIAEYRKDPNP